jgi:rubredoxin
MLVGMQQFESFRASELYCPKCKVSRPVRERLLLVLPGSELYDYRCTVCGTSVGEREAKAPPLAMQMAAQRAAATAPRAKAVPGKPRVVRGALPPRI